MSRLTGSSRAIVGLAVGAALLLTACGSDDNESSGKASSGGGGSTVKVAAISDVSGPTAETQVPYEAGIKAYFKEYEAKLSDGQHKLDVTYHDDKYDPALGLAAYKKAVANGDVGVIGPNASATHPAIVQAGMKIPLISGITSTIQDEQFLWNMLPEFTDQADIMIAHAKTKVQGDLRVAGLFFDVPSGVEFGEQLKKATEAAGGTYAGDVTLAATEAAGDWRAQAQALAELEPTFVGALSSAANPQTFLPAMANAGLTDTIVGGVTPLALYKENWTKVPESLGKNYFAISSISPADIESAGSAAITAAAEDGGKPEYANNVYFVQGYVAAKLLADAVNAAGDDPTPESVNEAISKLKNYDTQGLNPPFCFGPDDHYATGAARPIRVDLASGKFVADGEFSDYAPAVADPNAACG